jgi:biotin transport system substrate-specific component
MAETIANSRLSTLLPLAGASLAKQAAIVVLGSIGLAVLSQVTVPFIPVPMTLQTLGVLLIGLTFGFRMASATLALYLLEGLVGLPVFAGFSSGIAVFMGGTAGYLAGFLIAASVLGLMADKGLTKGWAGTIAAVAVGQVIIFGLGVAWLTALYGFDKAIAFGLLPFIYGARAFARAPFFMHSHLQGLWLHAGFCRQYGRSGC